MWNRPIVSLVVCFSVGVNEWKNQKWNSKKTSGRFSWRAAEEKKKPASRCTSTGEANESMGGQMVKGDNEERRAKSVVTEEAQRSHVCIYSLVIYLAQGGWQVRPARNGRVSTTGRHPRRCPLSRIHLVRACGWTRLGRNEDPWPPSALGPGRDLAREGTTLSSRQQRDGTSLDAGRFCL